jgi:hypothetical protein
VSTEELGPLTVKNMKSKSGAPLQRCGTSEMKRVALKQFDSVVEVAHFFLVQWTGWGSL